MPHTIRRIDYFYVSVRNQPGLGYDMLGDLARHGVNLLAFSAVPVGPTLTQLTLVPEAPETLIDAAESEALVLDGPHPALLVQGDDELGALASLHRKLFEKKIDVYASIGLTDGRGSYGYLLYVRPEDFERAASALDL